MKTGLHRAVFILSSFKTIRCERERARSQSDVETYFSISGRRERLGKESGARMVDKWGNSFPFRDERRENKRNEKSDADPPLTTELGGGPPGGDCCVCVCVRASLKVIYSGSESVCRSSRKMKQNENKSRMNEKKRSEKGVKERKCKETSDTCCVKFGSRGIWAHANIPWSRCQRWRRLYHLQFHAPKISRKRRCMDGRRKGDSHQLNLYISSKEKRKNMVEIII